MGAKTKIHPADTYVFDEDIMDEMENLEATLVLEDGDDRVPDQDVGDDDLLDDIESSTVVLDKDASHRDS